MSYAETRERWRLLEVRGVESDCSAWKHCVYYAIKGDLIKIGTTADLATRMKQLKPDRVLATELGSHRQETYRLRQFRHLRIDGTREWHHQGLDLWEHIHALGPELVHVGGLR